jgi:superfamily II DNA/RNA helicase
LPDLQRIIQLLPKTRQNLMFSATFSPEIKKLAATYLNDPQTIEVARSNATADNVTQTVYKIAEHEKSDAVSFIIQSRQLKQVIVFSNTKLGASLLARHLERDGVKATAIHGDKSQAERMAALASFKSGDIEVLVATDVAARGLDIAELPCVINVDLPYNPEDYVHRIGRTARAGAKGDAISLFSDKDERLLEDIEKLIHGEKQHASTLKRSQLDGFVTPKRGAHPERKTNARFFSRNATRPSPPMIDPWFLKPYEPTASAPISRPLIPTIPNKSPRRAALLGG